MTDFYNSETEKPEPTLKDTMNRIAEFMENADPKKVKKMKMSKLKVSKGKLKKGWVGVLKLYENQNASAEKVEIDGGAFSTKNEITHGLGEGSIFFLDGKIPFVIQPNWKKEPMNVHTAYGDKKNETYLQPVIRAKMLKDTIKPKRNMGGWIWWIIILGGGYLLLHSVLKVI